MHQTKWLGVTAVALTLAAACGGKKGDKASGGGDDKPSKQLDASFFGKRPAPLGMLAKTKWGSSIDAARTAEPALFDTPKAGDKPGDHTRLANDPELIGVEYSIGFDRESQKLSRMYLELPIEAKAMLATAWGAGKDATDGIGQPHTYWFDPASGWRAWTDKSYDDKRIDLDLSPYLPVAKLLGDASAQDQVGFAPQGVLGATIDDLRKRFPDVLVETDQKKANQDRKELNNMMGKDMGKDLGAAQPSVDLQLMPTEWASFTTPVHIEWDDTGHVEDFWFGIEYGPYPNAKADVRAQLDKKWPGGKPGTWIVDPATVSKVNDHYFVVITDDTIGKAWDVRITSSGKMLK